MKSRGLNFFSYLHEILFFFCIKFLNFIFHKIFKKISILKILNYFKFLNPWILLQPYFLTIFLGDIGTLNTSHDMIKLMPKLKPQDVADAVLYAISTPENVLIHELIIKPVGEFL